jgi:hypothetical protein
MLTKRTLVAALVAVVVVALLSASAVAAPSRAAGVTITAAAASVTWKESFAKGKVTFSFTTTGAANLESSLRNATTKRLDSLARFSVSAAGTYTKQMKTSAQPLPGTYILRVEELPTGGHADASLSIPAPPEGVVDHAYTSSTKNGRRQKVVPHARIIYAHFHFAARPQSQTITFNWRKPGNPKVRFTGYAKKPYHPNVSTFVCVKRPRGGSCLNKTLQKGKWYCILSAAGKVVKRQLVVVT